MRLSGLSAFSALATAVLFVVTANAAEEVAKPPAAIVAPLLTKALPDLQGKEVMMLTVEYPPGGVTSPHRHNANTFVYVLEGAVVMQVAGGKEMTLKAGETFYESPMDVHSVSRNASATQRAKFLVFVIKDKGAAVSVPETR
jgi:quercetin dioxygenase-like cupin family protein